MDPVPIHKNVRQLHMSPGKLELAGILRMVQKLREDIPLAAVALLLHPGALMPHRDSILMLTEWH